MLSLVPEQITYEISSGEYFWFPKALDPEQCTIHFEVKAGRDAVIIFSPERSIVENIYKIGMLADVQKYILTFDNSKTYFN